MVKPKTGGTTGRKKYHLTNKSSRSVGEELIDTGFGKLGEAVIKGLFNTVTGRGRSLWGGQIDRLRRNSSTIFTGKKLDKEGNIIKNADGSEHGAGRRMWNRATSALFVPFNVMGAAIAAPVSATAAVGKGAVMMPLKGAGYVAKKSARPLARFVGATTYESARVGGQVINGGLKAMRTHGFTDMAMAGTFVGVTGYGMAMAMNEIGGANRDFNGYASSLAGTTGSANTPLVNTGANGDLVLAMHKLR